MRRDKFLWQEPPSQLCVFRPEIHVWKVCLSIIFKENKDLLMLFSAFFGRKE